MFDFIVVCLLIGLVPAFIAKNKGREFLVWWMYGSALFLIALPHALFMVDDVKAKEARAIADGGRKCPFCAEIVKREATVCRYCQRDLPQEG